MYYVKYDIQKTKSTPNIKYVKTMVLFYSDKNCASYSFFFFLLKKHELFKIYKRTPDYDLQNKIVTYTVYGIKNSHRHRQLISRQINFNLMTCLMMYTWIKIALKRT